MSQHHADFVLAHRQHHESSEDEQHAFGSLVRDGVELPLVPQDFEDHWSEELVILYHDLVDACHGSGWSLFENLTFCEFCKFAYTMSSKRKP